eukprot:ANDGO_00991.mRNA.1 ATP-dependent 6-phosphofructokinase 6
MPFPVENGAVYAAIAASFGAGALALHYLQGSRHHEVSAPSEPAFPSAGTGMVRSQSTVAQILEDPSNKFSAMSKRRNLIRNTGTTPGSISKNSRIARLEDVRLLDAKDIVEEDRTWGESSDFKIPHLSQWASPFWYSSPCPFKPVGWAECVVADVIVPQGGSEMVSMTPITNSAYQRLPTSTSSGALSSMQATALATADHRDEHGPRLFLRGGPRDRIFFHPLEVRAAVATCGGLCPGLNTVIREVVMCLHYFYGVREVYGVQFGYEGFYKWPLVLLTPDLVADVHNEGGTILGTSRGGFDAAKICDSLEAQRINQVYLIGGDGTHRGALTLHQEVVKRGLKISVCGMCKTIDNDIPLLDRSFGFDTAVDQAIHAVKSAHVEIRSAQNGVGLVVVMGRSSGFIAMQCALAARDVNVCLIPEINFDLNGEHGLLEYIRRRIMHRGHCLILCAEGAGLGVMPPTGEVDASGNPRLPDIGSFLKSEIKSYLAKQGIAVNLKYIDPSYMIRSVAPNSSDSVYCTVLGQTAVHGCMAGFSGFTTGLCNAHHVLLPMQCVTKTRRVEPNDRMWSRVLVSTGQPSFTVEEEPAPQQSDAKKGSIKKKEEEAEKQKAASVAAVVGQRTVECPEASTE